MTLCPASSLPDHGFLQSVREGVAGQGCWQVVEPLGFSLRKQVLKSSLWGPGHRWVTLLYCVCSYGLFDELAGQA